MSLAFSTLLYEWRRYMAAIVALAACGVLILAFSGLFMGIVNSFSAIFGNTPADIVVLNGQSQGFLGGGDMPARVVPQVFQNPAVVEAREMSMGNGLFSNFPAVDPNDPTAKPKPGSDHRSWSLVIAIDPEDGSLTLPRDFSEQTIRALQEPYAVALDRSSLGQMGVKLGDKAKFNGQTVYVRAVLDGYPSTGQAMIFMSRQTGRLLGAISGDPQRVGNLLVRIKDPARVKEVAAEINAQGHGQLKAWVRTELESANQKQFLTRGGIIAIILIFLVVFTTPVSMLITWQTLQGAILANIKEFASLRALGVSMGNLRLIIIELSFWVGIFGLMLAGVFVGLIGWAAKSAGLPMAFPVWLLISVGTLFLLIAIFSGVLSLGVLKKSQPADLLR